MTYFDRTEDGHGGVVSQTTRPIPQDVQNRDAIIAKAQQALALNSTFLALASPTPAQIAAQVTRLTRECSALIRLVINQLDDTSDT